MPPDEPARPRRNTAWIRASPRRKRVLLGLLTIAVIGIVLSITMPSIRWVHFLAPVATLIGLSVMLSGPPTPP